MTSLFDTLERRGLIERDPHPVDRRKVLIRLTDEGRAIVDQMLPIVHAASTEAFADLSLNATVSNSSTCSPLCGGGWQMSQHRDRRARSLAASLGANASTAQDHPHASMKLALPAVCLIRERHAPLTHEVSVRTDERLRAIP